MNLRKEWDILGEKLSNVKSNYFNDVIVQKYSESHRHYHGIGHVNSLLRMAKDFRGKQLSDSMAVAIWFHDLSYDPTRTDNELISSELAYEYLSSIGAHTDFICEVDDLIYVTKSHAPIKHANASYDDQCFFIDIDMAVLGKRREKYERYVENVFNEYLAFYSEKQVKLARASFLKSLLERENIFYTDQVRERYGARAIENIKWELSKY